MVIEEDLAKMGWEILYIYPDGMVVLSNGYKIKPVYITKGGEND